MRYVDTLLLFLSFIWVNVLMYSHVWSVSEGRSMESSEYRPRKRTRYILPHILLSIYSNPLYLRYGLVCTCIDVCFPVDLYSIIQNVHIIAETLLFYPIYCPVTIYPYTHYMDTYINTYYIHVWIKNKCPFY